MKYTIFYSWQSDLPNNTNRGFIEDIINESIKSINDKSFEIEIALDRDTKDVPGSPNIVNTIIEKIRQCDIFVSDISIINSDADDKFRKTPNPNVLLELGYALSLLGTEKIILFFNETYGTEIDLPFDIRQNKRINYSLKQEDEKAPLRKSLSKAFTKGIKSIINNGQSTHKKRPIINVKFENLREFDDKNDNSYIIKRSFDIHNLITEAEDEYNAILKIDGSYDDEWTDKVKSYQKRMADYLQSLKENSHSHYLNLYKNDHSIFSLDVSNDGNMTANDIRVSIKVSNDFLLFDKFPKISVVNKPVMPKPVKKVKSFQTDMLNSMYNRLTPTLSQGLMPTFSPIVPHKRTHACYIKNDNEIYFWADRLLHKHHISDHDDSFIILPSEYSSLNLIEFDVNVFCSEYDEWETQRITLNIKNDA